jgi:catalase
MKFNLITSTITAGFLIAGVAANLNAETNDKQVQAIDLVEMFEKLGGKHPGFRKAHAKGMCAAGTFVPASNKHFTDAALLSNGELPVTIRFSVGGC